MGLLLSFFFRLLGAALHVNLADAVAADCDPSLFTSLSDDIEPEGAEPFPSDWVVTSAKLDELLLKSPTQHPLVIRGLAKCGTTAFMKTNFVGTTDNNLDQMLLERQAGTAEGSYPQIRLSVEPAFMKYGDARRIIRDERSRDVYTAVGLDMSLRELLYAGIELPRSLNDSALLDCLGPRYSEQFLEKLYWTQVFVGSPGTGMELHDDHLDTHVWGVQLSGSKTFVFCERPNGDAGMFANQGIGKNFFDGPGISTDGRCWHTTARPGDLIYWPSLWLHQSKNGLGDVLSVALSGMHVNMRRIRDFVDKLAWRPVPWNLDGALLTEMNKCLELMDGTNEL